MGGGGLVGDGRGRVCFIYLFIFIPLFRKLDIFRNGHIKE